MTKAVFLHIGLFKSGTTYLQHVLWESRDALADDGILVPGRTSGGSAFAATDLMGVPGTRRVPASYGAWDRVVEWCREWDGAAAVVSAERLTFARPNVIRRIRADLAPASVHVMVTVRDLARVVPSSWQERVRNRKTLTWPDFLAALTDPSLGATEPARHFWRQQDAPALLARWAEHVPAENISVVTVPPSGSDPQLLPARFAEAIGSDGSRWATDVPTTHAALGVTETEMLRRLNPRLPQRITTPDYNRYVKLGLARNALGVREARRQVRIPAEQAPWLEHQAQRIIDGLGQREYRIVGDLDDLMPSAPTGPPPDALTVSDDDMLDASLDVIAHLVIRLTEQLSESQPATESADPRELRVPDGYADWLERHASGTLDDLRTLGYRVVGDAEQQVLSAMAAKQPDDATVPTGELLDTSLDINAYLVTRLADTRP